MNRSLLENDWQSVWLRKGREASGSRLEDLMRADGFDAGTGSMSVEDWLDRGEMIARRLEVGAGRRVLEVGCGAGAMLATMERLGAVLHGVDYSESLVALARRAQPQGRFDVAEAAKLPHASGSFDACFSHGVFFYFSDLDYGRRALDEMRRVLAPGGRLFVLDVPDAALQDECERYRRDTIYAGQDYPTSQDGPYRHLYYPRSFFARWAEANGFSAEFVAHGLPSYPMSPYRFHVLLTDQAAR